MARVLDMLPKWEKVLAAMAGGSAGSSLGYGAHDPELTAQLDELREVLLRRLDGIEDQLAALDDAISATQANPDRFHIGPDEIERRKRFVDALKFQCAHLKRKLSASDAEAALFETMRQGPGAVAVLNAPMDAETGTTAAASFARDGVAIDASRISFVDNAGTSRAGKAEGVAAAARALAVSVGVALGPRGVLLVCESLVLFFLIFVFAPAVTKG